MANHFKDKTLRGQYDVAMHCYQIKHRDLFNPAGERKRPGCSWAQFFWQGFDGIAPGVWDATSKTTLAYAYWRAGQDAAKTAKHAGS